MSKVRMSIDFKNFEEMAEKLDGLGGDLKATADEALQKTNDYVVKRLNKDIKPHSPNGKYSKTGRTNKSLKRHSRVEWEGNIGEIHTGFDISHGGLPSIFLMYGTPRHFQPKLGWMHPGVQPDRRLYNDVYGSSTKSKIKKIQEEVFAKAIRKRMGG